MKILLDECLPKKLKNSLEGHTVITVPEQGWSGTKNGELLRLAENEFDVFLTVDRNLTYQQNLTIAFLSVVRYIYDPPFIPLKKGDFELFLAPPFLRGAGGDRRCTS